MAWGRAIRILGSTRGSGAPAGASSSGPAAGSAMSPTACVSPNECGSLGRAAGRAAARVSRRCSPPMRRDEAAVEETFVNKNARADAQARPCPRRGAAGRRPCAACRSPNMPPNEVKKAVVGAGHAEKEQVARMVRLLLPRSCPPTSRCRRRPGGRHLPCPPSRPCAPEGAERMIALLKGRVEAYRGRRGHPRCRRRRLPVSPARLAPWRRCRGSASVGKLFDRDAGVGGRHPPVGFANEAERAWFRLLTMSRASAPGWRWRSCRRSHRRARLGASPSATRRWSAAPRRRPEACRSASCRSSRTRRPALQLADPALARIGGAVPEVPPRAAADAVSALVNLGYGQAQAGAAVGSALQAAGR